MKNEHNEDLEMTNEDFSAGFMQHESGEEEEAEQGSQTELESASADSEDSSQVETQSDNEDLEIVEETEETAELDEELEEESETEDDALEVLKRELEDTRSREKLFKSRLEDLSDQYRLTRDSLEDLRYNSVNKKDEPKKKAAPELPASFKELKELEPEIATAVEELLAQRLSDAQSLIDSKVNTYIAPVQEQVAQMHQTTHMSRITAAHPDANSIAGSDEFTAWIDKLPAWEKRSADSVIKGGTSDEVIELLDYYKEANDLRSKVSTNKTKSVKKKVDEELVKKVRDAQVVKSNKTTPKTTAKADETDMDDFSAGFSEHSKSLKETDFWR